jgi:hypothetical protein
MEIIEFKWGKDIIDWVLAPNIQQAKEFYLAHSGCIDLDGYAIKSIPKSEWGNCYIIDINEPKPIENFIEDEYFNGYKIIETFADYADREKTIDIIASTEF